jgi:hypothetical protein
MPKDFVDGSTRPYTYSLDFSENDRYILYRDTIHEGSALDNHSPATSIAVFELKSDGLRLEARLLDYIKPDLTYAVYTSCRFHPKLPILGLAHTPMIEDPFIRLWEFKSGGLMGP